MGWFMEHWASHWTKNCSAALGASGLYLNSRYFADLDEVQNLGQCWIGGSRTQLRAQQLPGYYDGHPECNTSFEKLMTCLSDKHLSKTSQPLQVEYAALDAACLLGVLEAYSKAYLSHVIPGVQLYQKVAVQPTAATLDAIQTGWR